MAKKRVFAVIGLGTFGTRLCEALTEKGVDVIALDNDPESVDRMKNLVTTAVLVDATKEQSLLRAPLDDVDIAIVAIGDNMEASILATALLKRKGVPYILARAVTDIHRLVLLQVGANEVVNLEIDSGTRIAQRLAAADVLDVIPLSAEYQLAEVHAPRQLVGQSLASLKIREKFGLNVVCIRRSAVGVDDQGNPTRREALVFPSAADTLDEGDVLILVGTNADLDSFRNLE